MSPNQTPTLHHMGEKLTGISITYVLHPDYFVDPDRSGSKSSSPDKVGTHDN